MIVEIKNKNIIVLTTLDLLVYISAFNVISNVFNWNRNNR